MDLPFSWKNFSQHLTRELNIVMTLKRASLKYKNGKPQSLKLYRKSLANILLMLGSAKYCCKIGYAFTAFTTITEFCKQIDF